MKSRSRHPPHQAREGPETEWKERLGNPWRVAATVAGFANGAGGTIVFGVRDSGETIGVDDPQQLRRRLEACLAERLDPMPPLAFAAKRAAGRRLLELKVRPAPAGPVALLRADGTARVYVREGASSRPAGAREAKSLAHGPAASRAARLDPAGRALLVLLRDRGDATVAELSKGLRRGRRTVRRLVVELARAALILEKEGNRWWITPRGHRRLDASGGRR